MLQTKRSKVTILERIEKVENTDASAELKNRPMSNMRESIHQCPVKECHEFWCWSTTNVVQNKHFVICLIMAFREMRAGFKQAGISFCTLDTTEF